MKKITINNEVYVLESDVEIKPTTKQIVVLNRGDGYGNGDGYGYGN